MSDFKKSYRQESFRLYNTHTSCLSLGFLNGKPFISVIPVLEDMKGKKSKKGVSMYDYEHSTSITFNASELALLIDKFAELKTGTLDQLCFNHKSINNVKKIYFAKQISEETETKDQKVAFQIYVESIDRDSDSVDESYIFEFVVDNTIKKQEISSDLLAFEQWLKVAFNYMCTYKPASSSFSGSSFSRSSSSNDDEDSDDEDERPARKPIRKFSRDNASVKKSKKEEDTEEEDDDLFDE